MEKYTTALKDLQNQAAEFIQEYYPGGPPPEKIEELTSVFCYKPKVSCKLYYVFPHFPINEDDPTGDQVKNIQEFIEYLMLCKADIKMKYKIIHEGYI